VVAVSSSSEGPLDEFLKKIERKVREVEEAIAREIEKAIKELRYEERETKIFAESVEPLYTVRDLGNRLVVYVDIPYADAGKVDVWFEENVMHVKAKLRSRLDVGSWSERYRGVGVEEYDLSVTLPIKPKPEKTRVRVKRGVLEVIVYK
jgi:HSP20 family molecular chaperone IbpA